MRKKLCLLAACLLIVALFWVIAMAAGPNQTATVVSGSQTVQMGEDISRAACTMTHSSLTIGAYFGGFAPGMLNVSYFNPADFCAAPYPFEITAFSFPLYDPGGFVWPVSLDVVVFDAPDSCAGPGVELCRFTVVCDQATFQFPNVGVAAFPAPCCVNGPFFIGIEYTNGAVGSIPSICYDDTSPPEVCINWFFYSDGAWYEWYDIWTPPTPGYPMFWVDGETESANCDQGPCDWNPGDEYKMHFPQPPDEAGWDVNATFPAVMADDFECIESGYIKDIHFWGSWKFGATGIIDSFGLSLHSNITEQENPDGYSMPGDLLWSYVATLWTEEPIMGQYMEGWLDPVTGEVLPDNHQEYFQYNICLDEPYWFWQDAGTIYWLDITAYLADGSAETWGWKTSLEHFMDDAVYMGGGTCTAPDNGTGTVDLPADCPYVDVDSPLMIMDGLPPGTSIICDPTLDEYYNKQEYPGGSLGGDIHEFDAMLTLEMTGTGDLAGFVRHISMDVHVEIHTGPRNPGDPVQAFAAELWSLSGQIVGDPDFDYLAIQAGSAYGLPSPGQFEITDIGGGLYHIDSFFDITYQIDFDGAPGSVLDAMSGSTVGTSRWIQGGGSGWNELREPVFEQNWLGNAFWGEMYPTGEFIGGGENAFGEGWFYYPMYDWWNIWFYDHPYDPTRYKEVHFDVEFIETMPGGFVEFALNWSTDQWSIDQPIGDSAPPLPGVDEDLYIGRAILYAGPIPPGPMPLDFVIPEYNPEWVSVDVRGIGFMIPQGIISHSCSGYSLSGESLDLAFVITGGPEEPVPYDTVVCEPQGDPNPTHPDTYWYDVTPTIFGRCDFHVMVFDSVLSHYSNFVEPVNWTHQLHKVGNDWWMSFCNPGCTDAIFATFRFSFDNPYASVWGHWRTTADPAGLCDPYVGVVDSSENHTADMDGYGYRVHVPYFEAPDVDTCTYYKEPFEDYAPFGMPDFDQKQAGWLSPFTGGWSYCGPAAVANCFWWFDSKFETIPMVPPAISDHYPLVSAYGPWDDHDPNNVIPFISALGTALNTDMMPLGGTNIHMMASGVIDWLTAMGLIANYTVTLMPGDNPMMFEYIMEEVLISQDVILLLGFWEDLGAQCSRIGGHYVTVAGVCPDDFGLCISDPYFDMHEGEPPAGAAHPAGVHNDAQFISGPHGTIFHDKYLVGPVMWPCQPPFTTEVYGYPNNPIDIINFEWLNDGDFPSAGYQGGPIFTLIEYALVICPVDCDALIGEADNSGAIDIDDVVYLIAYIFSGGPAPAPYSVASGDADCSCAVDIDDVVYLIAYIFSGGPAPCTCEEWVAACGALH
ncbi:MAG: hypothetical protein KJ723_14810 [candidate division Zixibacteria bacterium]|nr:hypothetical protein [candidate division Zixibacteria bacterium]